MTFPSYIKTFLTYAVKNHFREFMQRKHQILNYCSSINDDECSSPLNVATIEDEAIDSVKEIIKNSRLTDRERYVIEKYFLESISMKEIAQNLKTDSKSLYYIKNIAFKKMHKSLNSTI